MSTRSIPAAAVARRESVWSATADLPEFPPLEADTTADVCVVGAGIAGLTTAYLLTQAGKSVVVLDDGPLAGGVTRDTTAHLVAAADDRFVQVERLRGAEGARLAAQSHMAAIDRIQTIVRKERIACDFQRLDGYLFLPTGGHQQLLDRELAAARRAGVEVEKVPRSPLASFDTGPCLRFPGQGQFHPLRYLAGLTRAIVDAGGRLFTRTHADQVAGGTPALVTAGPHTVLAQAVVVATNVPFNDLADIYERQQAFLTYAIGAPVPRGSVRRALFWDTEDPYHYIRLQPLDDTWPDRDLLIVGGEDHPTGRADDTLARHDRLERWARERFPMMEQLEFVWSGQVMETRDGLGLIGPNPDDERNVFIVTGDSGMGMTHGTIGAMLLTDLITGRQNPWTALYDPSRQLKDALPRVAEGDPPAAETEAASVDEIPPGSGAVVRDGKARIAVYRDARGELHQRSAACPHRGCTVTWNPDAATWDCPCHGSRFSAEGGVINGPSNRGLDPVDQ